MKSATRKQSHPDATFVGVPGSNDIATEMQLPGASGQHPGQDHDDGTGAFFAKQFIELAPRILIVGQNPTPAFVVVATTKRLVFSIVFIVIRAVNRDADRDHDDLDLVGIFHSIVRVGCSLETQIVPVSVDAG